MITEEACVKHDEKRLKSTASACLPREAGSGHKSPLEEAGSKVLIPGWNKEDNAMFNLCLELINARQRQRSPSGCHGEMVMGKSNSQPSWGLS